MKYDIKNFINVKEIIMMENKNSPKNTNRSTYDYQPHLPQNRGYQPNTTKSPKPPKPPKGTSCNDA